MHPLLPYQEVGAQWLAERKYALLGDEMRLGKTPQAIRAADAIGATPMLILGPAIGRTNWARELGNFSSRTLSTQVVLSGKDHDKIGAAGVTICSYDLLQNKRVLAATQARRYALLILDEGHYLKSVDAERSKRVLGNAGLIRRADRTWALSGTFAPNNASELWIWLHVFGAYQLGYDAFVSEFCTGYSGPYGFQITGSKNVERLRELLGQIMLRRTKKEVRPDLPQARYSDVVVEPATLDVMELEHAFSSYIGDPRGWAKFEQDMVSRLEAADEVCPPDLENSQDVFGLLSGLIPHSATLRRYIGILKARPVAELIQTELDAGLRKIVVFAIHKTVINILQERLKQYGVVTIYGGTDPARRDRFLERFRHDPKTRVLIGNIAACGTAIDASAASDVLFAEADWVPMNNAQAAARVDHPNQKNPITVRFVGLAGSIDEKVARALRRKTNDLAQIFDARSDDNLPTLK